ncbi:unnamed protein product [Boreogadus saida]
MDETLNMDNEVLDCQEPETNRVGILSRLRDRDLLRKRKAEAEEKEKQVESKRRARGEQRIGIGRRGRPRKIENLFEILPIQEKEKGEEQVQQAPQPPAEESLPEAVEAGPAHTTSTPRSIALAYIPTSPAPPLNVTSVETPVIASSFTNLFQTAPTLTLNPTPAQAPTQTPTPAPNSVSEPTVPAPSTQSPPLPPSSGQSQSETTVEAPVSAGPLLALAPAPAPASSSLEMEMEDVCLTQKEEAVNRLETDSVEGPSPPVRLSTTQGYFTDK